MFHRTHIPPHMLPFAFLIVVIFIGIGIAYILTLRRAISRCAPQNRATSPESAWLLMIPFFNLIWQFIFYSRLSETLEREFRGRGLPIEAEPARNLGLAVAVLHVCWFIPVIHFVTGVAWLVCFIFYWVKISNYSSQLVYQPVLAYAGFGQQPQPAPQARFCTKCGSPMRIDEIICQRCGARV